MSNFILQKSGSSVSLPVTIYSKSPNRDEFRTWSAVVSAADRPSLTLRVNALIIKIEISGSDTAKLL